MKQLSQLLDQSHESKFNFYGDLGIMYYTCLNIWILSYHKESYKYFHNSSAEYGLFKKLITVIDTFSREKIDRVAFGTFAVNFLFNFLF